MAVIAQAGTDVDCGGFMTQHAPAALANGNVTEAQLDVLLRRLFRVRLRLGHFDPPGPLQRIGNESVCTPASGELARDGVRQSVVLAKNDGGLLPLSAAAVTSAVVIGPNMDYQVRGVAGARARRGWVGGYGWLCGGGAGWGAPSLVAPPSPGVVPSWLVGLPA